MTKKEDIIPSDKPKDLLVYSSNIYTLSKRDFDKYGERIMINVLAYARDMIKGNINAFNNNERFEIERGTISDKTIIKIPIKDIMNFGDRTNQTKAKKAAESIIGMKYEMEYPILQKDGSPRCNSDGSVMTAYRAYNVVQSVSVNEEPGMIKVSLSSDTWERLFDMSKGYSSFSLSMSSRLVNPVAIRLYQILAHSAEVMTFDIDNLREILQKDTPTYRENKTLFLKKVIEPAIEEINSKTDLNITLLKQGESRNGRTGRMALKNISFIKKASTFSIERGIVLSQEEQTYLSKELSFTDSQIDKGLDYFRELKEYGLDLVTFLEERKRKILSAKLPAIYAIKVVQNELENLRLKNTRGVLPVLGTDSMEKLSLESRKKNPLDVKGEFDNSEMKEL